MSARQTIHWISVFGPLAATFSLALWQCSGDTAATGSPDAGPDSTAGSSSGSGSGSSSGSSSGSGSSSSSSGGASDAGSSSSSSSGGASDAGSSSSSSSGGASDAGSSSSSGGGTPDAGPVLCVAPGNPPGCVECITDVNCPTTAAHCLDSACVQCVTSTDCGNGATPVCYPSNHTCRASCAVDGGVQCNPVTVTPICNLTTGACVGCRVGGADCRIAAPVCDPTSQQCVQCVTNTDCMGTVTPLCDTTNNTCVGCLANADCATSMAGPVCRLATHACAPGCVNDSQCADAGIAGTDAAAPRCNTTNNACVECLTGADCTATTPYCDTTAPRTDRCEQCLPAALTGDAGQLGCDGGPGSNCQGAIGTGAAGPLVCR